MIRVLINLHRQHYSQPLLEVPKTGPKIFWHCLDCLLLAIFLCSTVVILPIILVPFGLVFTPIIFLIKVFDIYYSKQAKFICYPDHKIDFVIQSVLYSLGLHGFQKKSWEYVSVAIEQQNIDSKKNIIALIEDKYYFADHFNAQKLGVLYRIILKIIALLDGGIEYLLRLKTRAQYRIVSKTTEIEMEEIYVEGRYDKEQEKRERDSQINQLEQEKLFLHDSLSVTKQLGYGLLNILMSTVFFILFPLLTVIAYPAFLVLVAIKIAKNINDNVHLQKSNDAITKATISVVRWAFLPVHFYWNNLLQLARGIMQVATCGYCFMAMKKQAIDGAVGDAKKYYEDLPKYRRKFIANKQIEIRDMREFERALQHDRKIWKQAERVKERRKKEQSRRNEGANPGQSDQNDDKSQPIEEYELKEMAKVVAESENRSQMNALCERREQVRNKDPLRVGPDFN